MSVLVAPGDTQKRIDVVEQKIVLLSNEVAALKRQILALQKTLISNQIRTFYSTDNDEDVSQLDDQSCCVS